MAQVGRPTKLSGLVQRAIVEGVRKGGFYWVAAEAAGVSKRTFYRWMERLEAGEG